MGVREQSAADIIRLMMSDFSCIHGGTFFDTTHVSTPHDTSERFSLAEDFDVWSSHDPIGYSRSDPDPKHHGQAMRSPMHFEWVKSKAKEMQGLWSRGFFQKVLRASFNPQDRAFTSRFHYTTQRKGGEI